MVSQIYRDLISDGAWSSTAANRQTPEDAGLSRGTGWPASYADNSTGDHPERRVFNGRFWEWTTALIEIAEMGIPQWDENVDYEPASDASCFVTAGDTLYLTDTNTGPSYGNATDPTDSGQSIWREF